MGGRRITSPDYLAGNSMNLVSSEARDGSVPASFFFMKDDALFHAHEGIMKSFGEAAKGKSKEENKSTNPKFIGFEVVPKTEVSHFPDGHKVVEKAEEVQVEITQFADGEKSVPKTEFIDGHPVQRSFEKTGL